MTLEVGGEGWEGKNGVAVKSVGTLRSNDADGDENVKKQ